MPATKATPPPRINDSLIVRRDLDMQGAIAQCQQALARRTEQVQLPLRQPAGLAGQKRATDGAVG